MKIVLAVHHFPPHRTAGAELQAYRTAAALIERGHQVHVVCVESIDQGGSDGLTWRDDHYKGVPVRRLSFNLRAAPDPVRWEYDNLWIGEHLRNYFRQLCPDLFHLYGGYLISARPLLVAQEMHIPSVVSLTEFWFLCRRFTMLRSDYTLSTLPLEPAVCARCLGEEQRLYRTLGRWAPGLMQRYWDQRTDRIQQVEQRIRFLLETLAQASVVISQSEFVGSMVVQAGLPREKLIFCRQGQAFPHLKEDEPAKRPPSMLRVGYLGQIAWHKGVHLLVEAVRQLPQAALSVAIYGDLRQHPKYVKRLLRLAGGDPRIQLRGPFDHQQIGQVMRELDVLVVPSLWYENSPNVIFEAFAHRTPVVATRLGGMAELVHEGRDGLLFSVGDASDLARCIHQLVDEPALVQQLTTGIDPVRTLDQEMDELEAIYRSLVQATVLPLERVEA